MVRWTESDRVLIVKALIHVEEEFGPLVGKQVRKWEQVASLLPPRLRERQGGDGNDFKCRFLFNNVLNRYRAEMEGRSNGSNQYILTDSIRELLMKREHLMNALKANPAETCLELGSSNRLRTGQYLSEQSNDAHSTSRAARFDNNPEEIQSSMERNDSVSSFWSASRSSRVRYGSDKENNSAKSPVRTSPSTRSLIDDAEMYAAEPSARPRFRTRGPIRAPRRNLSSSARLPSNHCRGSSSMRRSATLMAHTSSDEHQHADLDGLQRSLDLEFSRLSSWMQSRSIPLARKDVIKRTSCAVNLRKRRKLDVYTATKPFDDLIQECASRCVDLKICALFQKLRYRLADEVRSTTMKLAHVVLPDPYFPCSSLSSASGLRNAERSMSPEIGEEPPGKRAGTGPASS